MPKITEVHLIEITPEKFLDSCSPQELYELELLLRREKYQSVIRKFQEGYYYRGPVGYPELERQNSPNTID